MSTSFELEAELREDEGKGASRRLRLQGKVPAVIYGGKRKPRSISLDFNELMNHARNEAFFAHVLKIKVGKVEQSAIVKDVQVHPAKARIMHVDFQRVMAGQEIRMTVPLHFLNEDTAPGIKLAGGVVSHIRSEVDIACLPKDLPEYIEVDVMDLQIDDLLSLSDLKLPKGVTIPELAQGPEHDQPVLSVHIAKQVDLDEEDTEAPEAPDAPAVGTEDEEEPDDS